MEAKTYNNGNVADKTRAAGDMTTTAPRRTEGDEPQTRVGFYCSSRSYGGLEMNVLRLIEWLRNRGTPVTLFAPPEAPIAHESVPLSIPLVEVDMNSKYFDFYHARKTARLLREMRIDVLFISATRDIPFGSLIKRHALHDLKLVYHQHMQLGVPKRDIVHSLRFRQYDSWIVPLHYMSEQVNELTRFKPSKVRIIPFCIDTKQFRNSTLNAADARRALQLPLHRTLIGSLGRIDPKKDQEFLIRAIHALRLREHDIDAVIMGTPTLNEGFRYHEHLLRLVEELGIRDHIHFRTFSRETLTFFTAIDIFAMMTTGETYGMVTIEALAAGVPVIANNSGGSTELLENGRLGLLYEPNNLSDFKEKIIQLLNDQPRRDFFRAEGRKVVGEKYDKDRECMEIEQLVSQLTHA